MADLVGAIATYAGDGSPLHLVSVDTISQNCAESDTTVPTFLNGVVGQSCEGYWATEQQIIDEAQDAARTLSDFPYFGDSCLWLRYYAPIVMREVFDQPSIIIGDFIGYWRISAKSFRITGATVLPTGEVICYYGVWDSLEWLFRGKTPEVIDAGTNPQLCGNLAFDSVTVDDLTVISAPNGANKFQKGSVSFVLLTDDSEYSDPGLGYKPGGYFMPIPPIPDGYPSPPAPPPLIGSAVVDALTDDECRTIVDRGGGFQTLTDIADYNDIASWEEFTDFATRMYIPTERNFDYFKYLLGLVEVDFWNTLDLGTGGGGSSYLLTLREMITAYDGADDSTKTEWLEKHTRDWILFDLLNAFALADTNELVAPIRQSLKTAVESNKVIVPGQVELVPSTEDNSLDIQWDINFKAYMKLKLQRGSAVSDNDVAEVVARYCDQDQYMKVPLLTYRNSDGTVVTDLPYKALMLDLLYQIRECCNPCPEYTPSPVQNYFFYADQTSFAGDPNSESVDIPGLWRVNFTVLENNFPKVVYFGTTPLQLLAKFAWRDANGRYDRIQWINTDNATFLVPRPDIVGFMCHCYVGVALGATVRLKNEASRPSPMAPP